MSAVLVVDSLSPRTDPSVESLRGAGFNVVVVPDPPAACSAVDEIAPEVVLAHVHAHEPVALGVEIANYLGTQPRIEDLPFILLSPSMSASDAAAVIAAGCDC